LAHDATGRVVPRRRLERAARQREERGHAADEEARAHELGVLGLNLCAPEVVPGDVAEQCRYEPRGKARSWNAVSAMNAPMRPAKFAGSPVTLFQNQAGSFDE
jgi:hypothetical protein